MGNEKMDITVVVPFFNEEENVKEMHQRLTAALANLKKNYEVIFIDDGSTDNSYGIIKDLALADKRLKVIRFKKNFGQTAAIYAGFIAATGDIIIPMDGDLQNDPSDIKNLISKINEGYDIVSGWRKHRKDPFLTRKVPSLIANRMISIVTGVNLHDYGCTLKAYRKEVVKNIKLYGEMHRFIPAIASWQGATISEIEVSHNPRVHGKAKYGMERVLKVVLDLMTIKFFGTFLAKPIYIFGTAGIILTAGSFATLTAVIIRKAFFGFYIIESPLTLLSILFLILGIMFILMGIIAEIVVRLYYSSESRMPFFIKETINL